MNSLNPEEKELLESVEKGEWESVENISQEIKRYQNYARHQINQQKVELTLSVEDSQKMQKLSQQLGKSITNLSQEILHKYLHGELIEREQ
jgi:hypothetical protein